MNRDTLRTEVVNTLQARVATWQEANVLADELMPLVDQHVKAALDAQGNAIAKLADRFDDVARLTSPNDSAYSNGYASAYEAAAAALRQLARAGGESA